MSIEEIKQEIKKNAEAQNRTTTNYVILQLIRYAYYGMWGLLIIILLFGWLPHIVAGANITKTEYCDLFNENLTFDECDAVWSLATDTTTIENTEIINRTVNRTVVINNTIKRTIFRTENRTFYINNTDRLPVLVNEAVNQAVKDEIDDEVEEEVEDQVRNLRLDVEEINRTVSTQYDDLETLLLSTLNNTSDNAGSSSEVAEAEECGAVCQFRREAQQQRELKQVREEVCLFSPDLPACENFANNQEDDEEGFEAFNQTLNQAITSLESDLEEVRSEAQSQPAPVQEPNNTPWYVAGAVLIVGGVAWAWFKDKQDQREDTREYIRGVESDIRPPNKPESPRRHEQKARRMKDNEDNSPGVQ